jgi:hypothetical protein
MLSDGDAAPEEAPVISAIQEQAHTTLELRTSHRPDLLFLEKIRGEIVVAFTEHRTFGIRNVIAFESTNPRPTRSRAYASTTPLPRSPPGSLPARAGSPLAGQALHLQDD